MTILNDCTKKVWKLIEGPTYKQKFKRIEHVNINLNIFQIRFIPSTDKVGSPDGKVAYVLMYHNSTEED